MFLFATCQKLKIFVFLAPILIKPQCNSLAVPFDNNKTSHFVNLCLIFSIMWYSYKYFYCSATQRGWFLSMVFIVLSFAVGFFRLSASVVSCVMKYLKVVLRVTLEVMRAIMSARLGGLYGWGERSWVPAGFILHPDFAPAAPASTRQGSGLVEGLLPRCLRWFPPPDVDDTNFASLLAIGS